LRLTAVDLILAAERPKRRHAAALQKGSSPFSFNYMYDKSRQPLVHLEDDTSAPHADLECGGMTPLWPFGCRHLTGNHQTQAANKTRKHGI